MSARATRFYSPENQKTPAKGSVTMRLDVGLAEQIHRIALLVEMSDREVLAAIVADQLPHVYVDDIPVIRKSLRIDRKDGGEEPMG